MNRLNSNRPISSSAYSLRPPRTVAPLRLGFVSLVDAVPLFVAQDRGFFAKHGLNVRLQREVGWATIREKVMYGELEAAHALCPLPLLATVGVDSVPTPCCSGMVISKGGNAIVLSRNLWKRGVRDGESLKTDISNSRHFRKYIIATVFHYSTHAYLLRDWLRASGIDPERDVQIVTLPPSQMCRNLQAGTIDGFCAGEPWPSLAISQDIGWSPANSMDIAPYHPEKVLMTREEFAEERREENVALIAALIEACHYCEQVENREGMVRMMLDRRRVKCDAAILRKCLSENYDYGMGRVEEKAGFMDFGAVGSTSPTDDQAQWILDRANAAGANIASADNDALLERIYRADLHDAAMKRLEGENTLGSPLIR